MKRISFIAVILMAAIGARVFCHGANNPGGALAVPYVSEVPDGRWTGSWKNACEEASIAMVNGFYSGQKKISIANAKAFMQGLFNIEHRLWGSDANTDIARTLKLITDDSDFNGRIVLAPTVATSKPNLTPAGRSSCL